VRGRPSLAALWACHQTDGRAARGAAAERRLRSTADARRAAQGKSEAVSALLAAGAAVDAPDSHKMTPLHKAAVQASLCFSGYLQGLVGFLTGVSRVTPLHKDTKCSAHVVWPHRYGQPLRRGCCQWAQRCVNSTACCSPFDWGDMARSMVLCFPRHDVLACAWRASR